MTWPDYMKRETLAKRMDLAEGAIDQLVKRGVLPPPVAIGDALRWRWVEVDAAIARGKVAEEIVDDPYLRGLRGQSPAPTRRHGPQQDRSAVSVPATGARD